MGSYVSARQVSKSGIKWGVLLSHVKMCCILRLRPAVREYEVMKKQIILIALYLYSLSLSSGS